MLQRKLPESNALYSGKLVERVMVIFLVLSLCVKGMVGSLESYHEHRRAVLGPHPERCCPVLG